MNNQERQHHEDKQSHVIDPGVSHAITIQRLINVNKEIVPQWEEVA